MLIFSGCSCAVFSIRQILAENTSDCVGFSVHGVFGDLPDLPNEHDGFWAAWIWIIQIKPWETEGIPQCH